MKNISNIEINNNSSKEDVANFLKIKLKLSNKIIQELDLDGQSLFMLESQNIDEISQIEEEEKEKLKNLLIQIKQKHEAESKPNIVITIESSGEDVAKFLKIKLNFSDESIKELELDGESLFGLDTDAINEANIKEEEKKNLIDFLAKQNPQEQKEPEIKISFGSNKDEVSKFLKEIIKLKEETIKKLDFDGETLFLLDENDINEIQEISNEEKKVLIKNLNTINLKINEESENKEVSQFLKTSLNFDDKSVQNFDLNGKQLLSLEEEELDKIDIISNEEKNILKKYLELMNISIKETSDKNDIAKFLKVKLFFSYKSVKSLNMNGKELFDLEETQIDKIKNIKKEEKERLKKFLNSSKSSKNEIQAINIQHKYNIFFILNVKDNYRKYLKIKTSEETYKKTTEYNCNLVYTSDYVSKKNETVKFQMYQVFSDKKINKLLISIKDIFYKCNYNSSLDISKSEENNFIIEDLKFLEKNDFLTAGHNIIIKEYLSYFFDKTKKNCEKFKKSLLKAILNKIYNCENVELKPDDILKFFKNCCEYKEKIENINALEIKRVEGGKKELNKEYYITVEDLDKISMKLPKTKFLDLLIEIFSIYDCSYLLQLIKSKYGKNFSREILDLFLNKKLRFTDLSFNNENDFNDFQINLLSITKSKEEIIFVIKLSKSLYENLIFIKNNLNIICKILEDNAKIYRWNSTNYQLSLGNFNDKDDIDSIFILLSDIVKLLEKKNYKILNYEEIFENLLNVFSNKELNELCKIHNIIHLLKNEKIDRKVIEKFYNEVHQKGLYSIKNKELKSEDIIKFLTTQDYFYFSPNFARSDNRDPEIFKYITITDEDPNYLVNIKLIKDNKLYNMFSENRKMQTKFYKILLDQMKKVIDFKSLFDIFPLNSINNEFTPLINQKFKEIIYTALDIEPEKLFEIFDNWLKINYNCNLNLESIIESIEINYILTSKYFFYLLKTKEMEFITKTIKHIIINFFLNQDKEGINNAESLISLLLNANTNEYRIYFLNQLNKQIMTENDFYQKEETQRFLLFKLFFERCNELLMNQEIANAEYLYQTLLIKSKILNDLQNNKVQYNVINNLMSDENDSFFKKILIITQNKEEADKIYSKFKENMNSCNKIFEELRIVEEFYTTFYSVTKEDKIDLIKKKVIELKNKNICEIIKINNIFEENNEFNFEEAKEESKSIKYKNSCFFMAIYIKNKDNQGIDSEDKIYKDTVNNFKETLKSIIQQKDTKEPFFEIKNIEQIMKAIKNKQNDFKKEIEFIEKEFAELGKDEYIKKDLLNDLNNFSKNDKIKKNLQGIIEFIEAYKELSQIQLTEFMNNLKQMKEAVTSKGVSGEEIKNSKEFLLKYKYDIEKESTLIDFYELFVDQRKSILFLKTIKEKNFDLRYLNEFIDESDSPNLQASNIDNLIYINMFFSNFYKNNEINSDEKFFMVFKDEFEKDKDIAIKVNGYLKSYPDIIQLYESFNENPEMTTEKISNLLKDSSVDFFKDEINNFFTFHIQYKNRERQETIGDIALDELRNKILLSSSNTNIIHNEDNQALDKAKLTKDFVNLIDNIKQLNQTLNNIYRSGYFHIKKISLKIKDGKAFDEKEINKDLSKIIEEYNKIYQKFKEDIKEGYIKYPILRFFYGQQFLSLYEKSQKKEINISPIINSVCMQNIDNPNVEFDYDNNLKELENISKYLEKLFSKYNINLNDLYNKNKVLPELNLKPGLYRKIKVGDNNDLIDNILSIFQNLTNNVPIINTLLLCNEDTSAEKIEAFLTRALLCEEPILFIISNMECLELTIVNSLIEKLKNLYQLKNKQINSYLLFLYEKIDSGLVRDLEKLIPERNIISNLLMKKPEKRNEELNKIELYSSIYSGYGKTTEIKYNVKSKNGEYKYLPIGGAFSRDYIINNLYNLKINFQNAKNIYLHLDLSETDNDDLMNEILFKLIILRSIDSREEIFYLGYDINIMIEIPKCFIEFDKKFKLLSSFKKVYFDKLCPLRLEEGVNRIGDSPIAIVAEVLSYYDNNQIETHNIDLFAPIEKTAKQCEQIIDKHFDAENQSYYQKMNFIKILSLQFRKFTNNVFLNYDIAQSIGKGPIIQKARKSVITNFISLTKVFTRSPFDGVLLSQNKSIEIFGKYNEEQAIEEGINKLADENEKKEVFSFKKIKPSLVFFNLDGNSLSIISNNDKNEKEFNDLKNLWNSQNQDPREVKELVDYKNLEHEQFLDQIKKLFSLDKMSINDIRKKCEDLGNYIFVSDNFIKMVRILLNIEAKIPVILMGETGVGKTKLLEMLATLYGKGKINWHRLQIHAGTTDKKIVDFIEDVIEKEKEKNSNDIVWIFLDEINTCNSLGLITEIMCNHTYLGKKIEDKFVFLGACNPYRIINKKMRESGLVYYNLKEKNKLNNLVYTVNPLPHSLLNFIFDFGSLLPDDEKKYIKNTVISILKKIKGNLIFDIENNDLNKIRDEIIESISICHDYLRELYDKSSVSMREIRRFGIFFEYFIKYFKGKGYDRMKFSLNMTIYLCYYLRINDKKCRAELVKKLNKFYERSFLLLPENETRRITREMSIEQGKGIALNRALRENLFTCFTCIDNTVPIIIIGKPGTGKSLSFQILFNTLKGENSESLMFRDKGKLYRYYYQGSETSTAEGIEQVFNKALKAKIKDVNGNNINLVFFDEMGLAERSSNNPLKVIHFLLEMDENNSVPFLGISNWRLDAAKINSALNLSITDYDIQDLEETALSIAEALDLDLSNKYKDFFEILAKTYYEYILYNQNSIKENKDFHGNRDFYNLIKTAMRELITKKEELIKNENKTLTEIGILSLSRNFGGLENSNSKIKEIFKELYADKFDDTIEISKGFSVLDAIKKNVCDPNSRYLMLISEGNDASDITKYLLDSLDKKYIELVGTKYKKDLGRYSEEILNKIKYIMETDNILILRNLDMIYPSLYDLFNQNFTIMGDKRYARIAFEYAKISSEVNRDFHVVVIVNKNTN